MEHIGEIEKRLWSGADNLRANSNFASNEYFLPVMGLIFLRHAYSRFLKIKAEIELPTRGGKVRPLTKEDFSQKGAIFLRPEAQFDHLVSLPDSADRAQAIIDAMEGIEKDYETLRGSLPKAEYQELDNDVLGQILRTFNAPALKHADGDIFGRIYEYFLTQFADQKAHDGGEFFTPVSLVQMIVNVIEPQHGRVLDPACGSGGMFVQSANFIERMHENPTERATFYGMEKNSTTIRLSNMNLAVHGLEGNIRKAITYYEDPHELAGKCDFVMANPPFNVDEVDAEKAKNDPRLPYGLPGVNKKGKVSNGNYLWISYFDSYLNDEGRAGFVMSSQTSSAGGEEAKVRKKLIEAGHVDVMMAIRSGFFYTRTVPCELWFLDRARPEEGRNKVLMIDARNVYRKVTRKIYDFTPEQQKNLLAIVWLYRRETERYLGLVSDYCARMLDEGNACFGTKNEQGEPVKPLLDFLAALNSLQDVLAPFLSTIGSDDAHTETHKELDAALPAFGSGIDAFKNMLLSESPVSTHEYLQVAEPDASYGVKFATKLRQTIDSLAPLTEISRNLGRQIDLLYKLATRLIETCEKECDAKSIDTWNARDVSRARKTADETRTKAVEQFSQVRYFWRQAHWLTERFPEAKLRDVEGLVKLLDLAEIKANDWSLTPGRYVGVAPEEEDENFDFEETLREIHVELEDLNAESVKLATTIKKNFEELGI